MTNNLDTSKEEALQCNSFQAQRPEITNPNSYAENQQIVTPLSDLSEDFSESKIYPTEKTTFADSSKSPFIEVLGNQNDTEKSNNTEITSSRNLVQNQKCTKNEKVTDPDPSQAPRNKYNIIKNPSFLVSYTMPPNLKPPQKPIFIATILY